MREYDENEIILYLDDNRGVYIPRDFALETIRECVSGVDKDDLDYLAKGPDQEWYWDVWNTVEQNAVVTDPDTGKRYTIVQNGAVFLVPEDMELPEDFFG